MSIKSFIKQYFIEQQDKKYEASLAEKKVTYTQWLQKRQAEWSQMRTVMQTDEEFVILQLAEGELAEYAMRNLADYFYENPRAQVVYGDEDALNASEVPSNPWFKPDWSPDLMNSYFYFGSIVAVRTAHFEKIKSFYDKVEPETWAKLFSHKKDNVYYIDNFADAEKWFSHCLMIGLQKGSHAVGHLHQILFTASDLQSREKFFAHSEFKKAEHQAMLRGFAENYCLAVPTDEPVVSIIIPSKDHPELLEQCIDSVKAHTDIPCEIVVVDNGSCRENREKSLVLLEHCGLPHVYEYMPGASEEPLPFNFSQMCNLGAEKASGKLLLFLNDDVTLCEGCIQEMAAAAVRPFTGAVGMKLLYPESNRIQHAGVTSLPMGPVHKLQTLEDRGDHYAKAGSCSANFSAVTAACLMLEKSKFQEVGGYEESLAVAFNDVDLCYKLLEAGYFNVCINEIFAYHHESLSRGSDGMSEEKIKRLMAERDRLFAMHPELPGRDPFYSEYLNRDGLGPKIVPAYLTSANKTQLLTPTAYTLPKQAREDRCFAVGLEDIRGKYLYGWSIVLGDDNACYERRLVLKSESTGTVFAGVLQGQYRPDQEENVPDQKNVALCGMDVLIDTASLPKDTYRIGILASNRVTRTTLIHWSRRTLETV